MKAGIESSRIKSVSRVSAIRAQFDLDSLVRAKLCARESPEGRTEFEPRGERSCVDLRTSHTVRAFGGEWRRQGRDPAFG